MQHFLRSLMLYEIIIVLPFAESFVQNLIKTATVQHKLKILEQIWIAQSWGAAVLLLDQHWEINYLFNTDMTFRIHHQLVKLHVKCAENLVRNSCLTYDFFLNISECFLLYWHKSICNYILSVIFFVGRWLVFLLF